MNCKVKRTKTMGRGVFAMKKFKKGNLIEVSPLLILSKKDTEKLSRTELSWYVFGYGPKRWDSCCLALGVGSLFNHSPVPNVYYSLDRKNKTMKYYAWRDIKNGEQLFIDYGYNPSDERQLIEYWENRFRRNK